MRVRRRFPPYLQGWIGAFGDSFHLEVHEIVDLGGDDVLVVTTAHGHPLGDTERETQFLDWTFINTLREGKIAAYRSFFDKATAFKAARLSE